MRHHPVTPSTPSSGPRARKLLLALVSLVGSAALVACSGDGSPDADKPAEGTASEVATQAPEKTADVVAADEEKPITVDQLKIIVPANPGGGWDQTGRAVQQVLQEASLAGSAQVTNVGGAGGTVGLASLATEKEPNTLMVTGLVMVGAVETNASTNRLEDTTPIAKLTEEPLVVVVPAESPYKTISELVNDMAETGQEISIAGGSAGGADNILAGQMLAAAGVESADIPSKLNYIAYSGGGESLAALLGGKVSAGISGVGEYAEQVAAGKLKALAVSGPEPSKAMPDVPTFLDAGYEIELTNWRGVIAPGSIDDETKQALTDLMVNMHQSEQWTKTLTDNNWDDAFLSGDEFAEFLTGDIAAVQQTLKDLGLVK